MGCEDSLKKGLRKHWCPRFKEEGSPKPEILNLTSQLQEHTGRKASQVLLVVKNLPVNAGDARDLSSIPGSGRAPGGGHGNPLQYSCLENPMDRRAW